MFGSAEVKEVRKCRSAGVRGFFVRECVRSIVLSKYGHKWQVIAPARPPASGTAAGGRITRRSNLAKSARVRGCESKERSLSVPIYRNVSK
jgi:hypothetical protein